MASSIILCCLATRIPREHPSILLSLFLSALDAHLRSNKPFTFLAGDIPMMSEPILELQEIRDDNTYSPKYNSRYFLLTKDLESNRPYIEMYPGESFGKLELESVEMWRMGQERSWDCDAITGERVGWRCEECCCSWSVRVLRGSG